MLRLPNFWFEGPEYILTSLEIGCHGSNFCQPLFNFLKHKTRPRGGGGKTQNFSYINKYEREKYGEQSSKTDVIEIYGVRFMIFCEVKLLCLQC